MENINKLVTAIRAGYSYFYINTYEMNRTVETVCKTIADFTGKDGNKPFNPVTWDIASDLDPEKVMEYLEKGGLGTVVVAKNFNWFLKDELGSMNKGCVQFLQNNIDLFSSSVGRKILIIVSDSPFGEAIPKTLEKDFLSIEMGLPQRDEIKGLYDQIIQAASGSERFKAPSKTIEEQTLLNCRGLTSTEITNALSYSLIESEGKIVPKIISRIRAQGIEKVSGIKIGEYTQNFDTLKGYDNIKTFTKATLMGDHSEEAKGILLLGPPGTGKTHFCRCLGNETGLEVYEMEIAQLFGGLVGESEKLMKAALDIVAANAPCILFIDEIEKALAGAGGGQNDGGTTQRSMAQLLKFLSDSRPAGVYVVATCNNISNMPPEWVRAERWDCAPFFIDLPQTEEQEDILKYYQSVYKVKGSPKSMDGWSGAEIKSACRIAKMMGQNVSDVDSFIVPVSKTMKNEIEGLRKWADGKTIPASTAMKTWDGSETKKKRKMDL